MTTNLAGEVSLDSTAIVRTRGVPARSAEKSAGRLLLALLLAAVTVGCGGGSGDDPPPSQPPPQGGNDDAWVRVDPEDVASVCGLDPDLLAEADLRLDRPYAVVRYGRLCHEHYPEGSSGVGGQDEVWSATKTLAAVVTGIAAYETRHLPRNGRKTGPLSDTDRIDHWLDELSFHPDARVAHVLGMVARSGALEIGRRSFDYDGFGNEQIDRLNDVVRAAIGQDAGRLGQDLEEFTQRFLFGPVGMRHSQWSSGAPDKSFAVGWVASLRDMARLGLLLLRRGVWDGRRVLAEEWVYRMTHPSFEDANTGYGYLTWLNASSNWTQASGMEKQQMPQDPCAPVALHRTYPHEPSGAPDCGYAPPYDCEQEHDGGVWWAEGAYGQLIVGHPGLDLVLVVKNLPDELRPTGVWDAMRPALVALDPRFRGDEAAFCAAYAHNEYAPDLRAPTGSSQAIVEELARAGHVLWVAAHPDDELAQAPLLGDLGAERGVELSFLLATRGEATTKCFLAEGCVPDVATVRAREMAASAALLQGGEARVVQLGLPDGPAGFDASIDPTRTMRAWDQAAGGHDRLVAAVRDAIREIAPGAVVFQDPRHGTSCHPDHRAIGSLVVEALLEMGVAAPPAYMSETALEEGIYFVPAEPADPLLIRYDATAFGTVIGGETWRYTIDGLEAHASQFDSIAVSFQAAASPAHRATFLVRWPGAWPVARHPGYDARCAVPFGYGPAR